MDTPVKKPKVDDGPDWNMVVGFLFTPSCDRVVLIRKTHPAWQAGKFNGLGGHINPGEAPKAAMAREFEEESGLAVPAESWREYARMEGTNQEGERWMLHVFCAVDSRCELVDSKTQEAVFVLPVETAWNKTQSLSNLSWLVPLAIDSIQSTFPCKVKARIQGEL